MPRKRNGGGMPHLPGYYYDADRNRYFKGSRPKHPPLPPRRPRKRITLPRLLDSTALGASTTQSSLHAALLPAAKPCQPISPTPCVPQLPHPPTETLACKLSARGLHVLAFPDTLITAYRYRSRFPPLSITSHGTAVAYTTSDGVYLHQTIGRRYFGQDYLRPIMAAVSLSSSHFLIANGSGAELFPLTDSIAPKRHVAYHNSSLPNSDILSCALDDSSTFALGTRHGSVVVHDAVGEKGLFYPSWKQRSVTALCLRGELVWCSTMGGGWNLSARDLRDLRRPAIVCKGQSNLCKMVGMDATESLVVAGGDDEKVRVWDIRGGAVLSEIEVSGIVKRVKMVGWAGGSARGCGVWLDTGDEVYARVVGR